MRLGVPYQGSKNAIAREIISVLPRGRRFVDLFAGGCAMTHAAILSGKYEKFLVNDIQGFGVRLFVGAIKGECNGAWKRWVSREEFMAKRDTDPLVALCWSFSNNGRDYLYAKTKEAAKRAEHERRARGEKSTMELESDEKLQGLRQCEALERLQALERDYREVEIADGDVVYADPPYAGTQKYNAGNFDSCAFWAWVQTRPFPVFVSEYSAPVGFTPIWCKGKQVLMNQKGSDGKVQERLFVADRYANLYQTDLFLGMTNGETSGGSCYQINPETGSAKPVHGRSV
jgi:16S rRNA G966 N2-methylase RsmD